jgi:hypothetical protein
LLSIINFPSDLSPAQSPSFWSYDLVSDVPRKPLRRLSAARIAFVLNGFPAIRIPKVIYRPADIA